jgi:hypothetical protein
MSIVCSSDPPRAGHYVVFTATSPGVAKTSTLTLTGAVSGEGFGGGTVSYSATVPEGSAGGSIEATARYKDFDGHTTEETQSFEVVK